MLKIFLWIEYYDWLIYSYCSYCYDQRRKNKWTYPVRSVPKSALWWLKRHVFFCLLVERRKVQRIESLFRSWWFSPKSWYKNLSRVEKIKGRRKILNYFTFAKCTKFSRMKRIHCMQTQIWYDGFNLIQNDSFWGFSRMGSARMSSSLKLFTHILRWCHLA